MLRAAIKEAHLDAFQQEIDNSSYMVLALIASIHNAPLLQPTQSRVRARRPNRKDVFLACYRIISE